MTRRPLFFNFVGHPCRCSRFRCGLFWGQVGALSSLSHFNAVSKQSSWFDNLLCPAVRANVTKVCRCHEEVGGGLGECLIYKVVWADGLCQLLSHVRARIQGLSAEYCNVARRKRWYLFLLSVVPILLWWGDVEGAPSLQLVHKNHPRKARKENPTSVHKADSGSRAGCFKLWMVESGGKGRHAGELLQPEKGGSTWWPP